MNESANGSQQTPQLPVPDEVIQFPTADLQVRLSREGHALFTIIVGKRHYLLQISAEAREDIGRMLLGPSVHTYTPEDAAKATGGGT